MRTLCFIQSNDPRKVNQLNHSIEFRFSFLYYVYGVRRTVYAIVIAH